MESNARAAPSRKGDALLSFTKVATIFEVQPNGIVTTVGQHFRLLELPAELRNKIYEYTLCESSTIDTTAALQPPALLSTCKEIRTEALGIWYMRNSFTIDVYDCDVTLNLAFEKHLRRFGLELDKFSLYTFLTGPHWENLMTWCYHIWSNEVSSFGFDQTARDWTTVIEAAHGVAAAGKESTWEVCRAQLEKLRRVARIVDARWLR